MYIIISALDYALNSEKATALSNLWGKKIDDISYRRKVGGSDENYEGCNCLVILLPSLETESPDTSTKGQTVSRYVQLGVGS